MARKKGSKNIYTMQNGHITQDDIFLYTPQDTIPSTELKRFLQQCDNMIILLDARTVNTAEIEEIAKVYRESVILDRVYREWATSEAGIDPTQINSIDKLLKAVEKRKENLDVRAKDRQEKRDLSSQVTMMDVIAQVGPEVEKLEKKAIEEQHILEAEAKKLTSTEDYMSDKGVKTEPKDGTVSDTN